MFCINKEINFDLGQFSCFQDEFLDVDLYDDVIATPLSEPHERGINPDTPNSQGDRADSIDTNGTFSHLNNPNHIGRRHQLYVGNLTWVKLFMLRFIWIIEGKHYLF